MSLLLECFFFQAEDGIRDADVTGVQTCALPISDGADRQSVGRAQQRARVESQMRRAGDQRIARKARVAGGIGHFEETVLEDGVRARSEERRVGKEWA